MFISVATKYYNYSHPLLQPKLVTVQQQYRNLGLFLMIQVIVLCFGTLMPSWAHESIQGHLALHYKFSDNFAI